MKILHFKFVVFFLVFQFTGLNAQDYPLNEEVKIYFIEIENDSINDWFYANDINSATHYRLVNFKEKNIPSGIIKDYYLDGKLQATFYANFLGEGKNRSDSIVKNGPYYNYHADGKTISQSRVFMNGIQQGKQIDYNTNGVKILENNYLNGIAEGIGFEYYLNGNIKQEFFLKNGVLYGEVKYYYEDGELLMKGIISESELNSSKFIGYYKSGSVKYVFNVIDKQEQGPLKQFYESGELEYKSNYYNGLLQGKRIRYYKSGEIYSELNMIDDLAQGKEEGYYKTGEVLFHVNYINNLKQGKKTYYLKNGEIDFTELYLDDNRVDRKIALVIGNSNYEKGALKNPVNDANLIAESLKKLDFEVELHTNLSSRNEMLDAIKDFGRKRANYEIGFVFYAGHGIQLNNENYLLPVNEEFEYEDDVVDNGVSMQRVLRYLESTRENQLNFIVLDACRDNPFESNWNKTRSLKGGGLAKIPPPTGSLIAYSTDHGQTAADGNEGNSLYSKALAEKLLEEDVSIEQVFKNVRTEVLRLSNKSQSPVEESKLTGDVFYLNKKKVD